MPPYLFVFAIERVKKLREFQNPSTGIYKLIEMQAHPDFSVADLHRPCMTA
jgi:hypothetical protein